MQPKDKVTLMYSKREENTMKEVFTLLVQTEEIKGIENWVDTEEVDELCSTLVNISLSTGLTFQLCRLFLEDEFKQYAGNMEGSIMRGNSIASKLTKSYLNKVGQKYLEALLGPIVHQIVVAERKKSLEVDQTKLKVPEEFDKNRIALLEKMKIVVDTITSQNSVDTMPAEMRIIASYFAEFAQKYAPKQVSALVGGFLLLRYFNPALMTPEAYKLLPEGKVPDGKPRRNLILITKILQNLSNGVEFGKKEQFMMCMNEFILANKERMERYLEKVIDFSAKSMALVPDPTAVTVTDLHLLHRVFTQNTEKILPTFQNKEASQKFSKLLEKLGSYQSKISFSFLNANDRKTVASLLEQYKEETAWIGIVDKKKRGKVQKRILLISDHRIFSIIPGGKVAREAHLLDLVEIKSPNTKELELLFKSFYITCETEYVDDIIYCARKNFNTSFSGMPKKLQFKCTVEPASRLDEITVEEIGPCNGFVRTYQSLCNYYGVAYNEEICWHFQNLPKSFKVFDLKRFTKTYSEKPLTTVDLGPLFWALRFNSYFDSFYIDNYKLDKESFLDLAEMLKFNKSFQELVLTGAGGTKDGFLALFEALTFNKGNVIKKFNFSSNSLDDKGLNAFATYLQTTSINVESINISDIGADKKALATFFNAIKDRAKTKEPSALSYLAASDNKVDVASDALGQMLQSCGTHLRTLVLANISGKMDVIADAIKRGCPSLETLDLSRNKFKSTEALALCKTLENSNITYVNLSSARYPVENLKDLLMSVANNGLDVKFNLSDNGYGSSAATAISEISVKMSNVHTLNLADNELGEEGIATLAGGLCSNMCIRHLIIDRNWKSAGKSRTTAIDNIIKMIQANPFIDTLSLEGSLKSSVTLKSDIVPFLQSLGINTTLTSINISGHDMKNKGAIALAKALQTNHTLTSITWDDNLTSLLGFTNIKNALKMNQTLKNMPLPVCDIAHALKTESSNSDVITKVLNKIETLLLHNQQI